MARHSCNCGTCTDSCLDTPSNVHGEVANGLKQPLCFLGLSFFRGSRKNRRFVANAADEEAAQQSGAGEDSWSMTFCLWLLNPAVVFNQLSSKVGGGCCQHVYVSFACRSPAVWLHIV